MGKSRTVSALGQVARFIRGEADANMEDIECSLILENGNRLEYSFEIKGGEIQSEILDSDSLIVPVLGSQGQMKNEVSPLLPHYDKAQRTLLMQLEALGLNYSTTPSKVKEDTRKGVSENDTLTNTLAATREEMNNPDGFIIPE